jgi:hypothetical protein
MVLHRQVRTSVPTDTSTASYQTRPLQTMFRLVVTLFLACIPVEMRLLAHVTASPNCAAPSLFLKLSFSVQHLMHSMTLCLS